MNQELQIKDFVQQNQKIVIMQADNPDGDSLATSLALEQILGDMGKEPVMYCAVQMPTYLRYMDGWDRVQKDMPISFDASIIVDTSAASLFGHLSESPQFSLVKKRPCLVIDHHPTPSTIDFATHIYKEKAVATGELLYLLAKKLDWPVNLSARRMIAVSIMADSIGLMSEATTPQSIRIIADLVEDGVKLSELDDARRQLMRKSPDITRYKGQLLQRIEYSENNQIATIVIPWEEIVEYSPEYNPSMLVIDDMRLTTGTDVAIAFKVYKDGKITAKIRCNYGKGIGDKLAEHFGAGGHPYASGFKIQDGRTLSEIKSECIAKATELLDKLKQEQNNEAIQHPNS